MATNYRTAQRLITARATTRATTRVTCLASVMLFAAVMLPVASALAASKYRFDDDRTVMDTHWELPEWTSMMARYDDEMPIIESCLLAHKNCPHYLKGYRLIVRRAQGASDQGKVNLTNRFINQKRWVKDRIDNEPTDVWHPIVSFLRAGGDCEDFAIAKYFMLRRLGIRPEQMRIVAAWDRLQRGTHALLAVELEGQALLLDTDDSIYRSRDRHGYAFLYSVNEFNVWHHPIDSKLVPWEPTTYNKGRKR